MGAEIAITTAFALAFFILAVRGMSRTA